MSPRSILTVFSTRPAPRGDWTDLAPRNRAAKPIGRAVQIQHAGGTARTDRAGLVRMVALQPTHLADFRPVPGRYSVISGAPALIYHCGNLEIPLTAEEISAMTSQVLRPFQVRVLKSIYGGALEWQPSLYDLETNRALQPQAWHQGFLEYKASVSFPRRRAA